MAGALLVLYASRELGLSAGVIGLALGIGAVGGLVGAVLAPWVAGRIGVGPTILVGAVLFRADRLARASEPKPEFRDSANRNELDEHEVTLASRHGRA